MLPPCILFVFLSPALAANQTGSKTSSKNGTLGSSVDPRQIIGKVFFGVPDSAFNASLVKKWAPYVAAAHYSQLHPGAAIMPKEFNEKIIGQWEKLNQDTGMQSSGERMEIEATWLNYALGMQWTHLDWKFQMPLLSFMTPMMDAGPLLTDIHFKYHDIMDAYDQMFPQDTAGAAFGASMTSSSLMLYGPIGWQMKFHARMLYALLRSHFESPDEGGGLSMQCLDLIGTNLGIVYPGGGGGPYVEFGCGGPMLCSACIRLLYTAGMGGVIGAKSWGLGGGSGCIRERAALSVVVLRSWVCANRKHIIPGPYNALINVMSNVASPTAAKICYDLQMAALSLNLHQDSSNMHNSYSIGAHCLLTLDTIRPHKREIMEITDKVIQLNVLNSHKPGEIQLSVDDALSAISLWLITFHFTPQTTLDGLLCRGDDLHALESRFPWMERFPGPGCTRFDMNWGGLHKNKMDIMSDEPTWTVTLRTQLHEIADACVQLDNDLQQQARAMLASHDEIISLAVSKDVDGPESLHKVVNLLDEIMRFCHKLISFHGPLDSGVKGLTEDHSNVSSIDALRELVGVEQLDTNQKLMRFIMFVVLPTSVHAFSSSVANEMDSLDLFYGDNGFQHAMNRCDKMEDACKAHKALKMFVENDDLVPIVVLKLSWDMNLDIEEKIVTRLEEMVKSYAMVAAETGSFDTLGNNPFHGFHKLMRHALPTMLKYQRKVGTISDEKFLNVLQHMLGHPRRQSVMTMSDMSTEEVRVFLRETRAGVRMNRHLYQQTERFAMFQNSNGWRVREDERSDVLELSQLPAAAAAETQWRLPLCSKWADCGHKYSGEISFDPEDGGS